MIFDTISYLSDDILQGDRTAMSSSLKQGFHLIKKYLNMLGKFQLNIK